MNKIELMYALKNMHADCRNAGWREKAEKAYVRASVYDELELGEKVLSDYRAERIESERISQENCWRYSWS